MAGSLLITTVVVVFYVFDAANGLSVMGAGKKNEVDLTITTIYPCDEEGVLNAHVDLKPEGLSFDGTIETTFDDSYRGVLQYDKNLAGDQWKDNFYTYQDKMCDILDKFASRAWEKIRKSMQPPIPDKCKIEPGTYSLKNHHVPFADIDIPSLFYGLYRATLKIYNKEDELYFCTKFEILAKKK